MKRRPWKFALLLLVPLALYFYIAERNSWRPKTIRIYSFDPVFLEFSPDGRTLIFGDGGEFNIYVCDVALRSQRVILEDAYAHCFIENGKYLAAVVSESNESRVKIFSMPDGAEIASGPKNFRPIGTLADESTIIGHIPNEANYCTLYRWNWHFDSKPQPYKRLTQQPTRRLRILADKTTLTDGEQFWDLATGKLRFKNNSSLRYEFDNASRFMTSLTADRKTVQIWNCKTGKKQKSMPFNSLIRFAKVSPDGTLLAESSMKPQVNLWDVQSGKVVRQLDWSQGHNYSEAFSCDGRTFAIADQQAIIHLWRIK